MFQSMIKNWQTSLAGVGVIALGAAEVFGVHIPGFTMSPGAAFMTGGGLLLAQDGAFLKTLLQGQGK